MKTKVLIVDDDISIINILKKILEFENFEVHFLSSFDSLDEVIAEHGETSFDLLILDYMLGSFSGLDLLDMLREGVNVETPAILITAYVLSPDVSRKLLEEDIKFVRKPFNRTDLMKTIREALSSDDTELEDLF